MGFVGRGCWVLVILIVIISSSVLVNAADNIVVGQGIQQDQTVAGPGGVQLPAQNGQPTTPTAYSVGAADLDKALGGRKQKIDAVLNLSVDEKVIVRRITGRRICPKCAAVYHVENLRPRVDGKCDKDGSSLLQRPDDTAEVVVTRLKNYNEQTAPLVDYYKRKNTVYDIDANEEAEDVRDLMFSKLASLA